jgi:hypothetical protein
MLAGADLCSTVTRRLVGIGRQPPVAVGATAPFRLSRTRQLCSRRERAAQVFVGPG